MGVMPQMASGENTLSRSAIAPTSLPSIYTGLPLIPPATLVCVAFPVSLATTTSCFGPQALFHMPMISTGTGSGFMPEKTVQATPFIPGFRSFSGKSWTGPALGGSIAAYGAGPSLAAKRQEENTRAAIARRSMEVTTFKNVLRTTLRPIVQNQLPDVNIMTYI